MKRSWRILLYRCAILALVVDANALRADTLSYTTRTQPYSGFYTTIHGDLRAVGMAGAMAGLGDTFIASTENPAGLAMTLNQADANITTNWARDVRIQSVTNPYATVNAGVAFAPYPWGLSIGYVSPYSEGIGYSPVDAQVTVREFSVSGARVAFDDRVALGASLIAQQAEAVYGGQSFATWNLVGAVGALVQLPHRFLLGATYHLGSDHPAAPAATQPAGLPGFDEDVLVPSWMSVGVAWIPNRFFRTAFSLQWVGTTPGAALLRDQTVQVGSVATLQPHIGGSYEWADFKQFQAYIHGGSYLEISRIAGALPRVHLTGGVEFAPWIFIVGWGLDTATDYQNALISFGVNIVKALDALKLIPHAWSPPSGGWFPQPAHLSDLGLARPLVRNWHPLGPQIDPIQAGLAIPEKIGERAAETGRDIKNAVKNIPTNIKKGLERRKEESDERD